MVGVMLFYLGKGLEFLGMLWVMIALVFGITQEHGMWMELYLGLSGIAAFMVGRLLERRAR